MTPIKFHLLKTEKDKEDMKDIVSKTLKINVKEENIFYEYNQDEDLRYYKEVVHVPQDEVIRITLNFVGVVELN